MSGTPKPRKIAEALERLHATCSRLAEETDPATHPVRAASLTGTQAFIHLIPDWRKTEQAHGRPQRAEVAPNVGEKLDESDIDPAAMAEFDLVDTDAAMANLERLVELLPRARAYSVSQLARLFTMFAPLMSEHASYVKVRGRA